MDSDQWFVCFYCERSVHEDCEKLIECPVAAVPITRLHITGEHKAVFHSVCSGCYARALALQTIGKEQIRAILTEMSDGH